MIEEFNKYTSSYDLNNPKIKLKYDHSFRVMELNQKYAKLAGFNEEDVELAGVIGLLHDIGRFEQLKIYDTFIDLKSIDHADFSVKLLFEDNLIEKFYKKKELYPIIEFAIKNHNKLVMDKCNDERTLKHALLIKDSDKVDIMYTLGVLGELNNKATDDVISDEVMGYIKRRELIPKKATYNKNELYAVQYAFSFDINNDFCIEDYKKYFLKYHERIMGGEQFEKMKNIIIDYFDERLMKDGN